MLDAAALGGARATIESARAPGAIVARGADNLSAALDGEYAHARYAHDRRANS